MIIDAHGHISNASYGSTEQYLEIHEKAGISHGVVVPGGTVDVRRMSDYISGKIKPDNLVPNNDYVAHSCETYKGRITGFAMIDPHADDALGDLEQRFKTGFRGLKLSPMTHQFSFASRAVAELVSLCGDFNYPVYSHVVYNPGSSTSKYIALAKQFPKTNFILGHMGFGPADQEGLEAAVHMDNFFLETSSGSFLHIKESVKKAGASKIIFGSEYPLSHPQVELTKIMLLQITDDERDKILGLNIKNLLRLSFPNN
ncbi:MAG: amidohydrolase family protein [Zhaonellaceae bacterium]|jgi:predicted TIM-barrel fold metal-dependent hydrolase